MAITPQAIKDQEFQSKFRGYDTIEVKAYLELVAEEFFELLERLRQQEDEIAEQASDRELANEINKNLESDLEASQRTIDELRRELGEKDEAYGELSKEVEELQTALADYEQERKEYEDEISEAEERVSAIDDKLRESRTEIDGYRNKISLLEEQNKELREEEVDFKRTIGVAQRFADDLMEKTKEETTALIKASEQKSEEMLRFSEEKAAAALQAARDEIERLRREAYAELTRLPEEIERLNQQRKGVREELRSILTTHLNELDSFPEGDETVTHYEYDDLFEKIDLPDAPVDQPPAETGAASVPAAFDELDDISMELPLSEDEADSDEDKEDLKNKLEEGGVAYLSDN